MKKIILMCCIGTLGLISSCSIDRQNNGNENYEGVFTQLKVSDSIRLVNATVTEGAYYSYSITPSGFDYEALNKKNYTRMRITVNYHVSYKRTYQGWDLFYKGAPKFDVYIINQDGYGQIETGLEINSNRQYSLIYSAPLMDLRNDKIKFKLGSTNIQNEIYFTDMTVDYSVD